MIEVRHIFRVLILIAVCANRHAAAESCDEALTLRPVPGLYESIKPSRYLLLGDLEIKTTRTGSDDPGWTTTVVRDGVELGRIKRVIKDKHLTLDSIKLLDLKTGLRAPKFLKVPGAIDLVSGRGIPTSVYLTLLQLRLDGVRYGELSSASMFCTNVLTGLQLRRDPTVAKFLTEGRIPTPEIVTAALPRTNTGRYISTIFSQLGLSVDECRVSNTPLSKIGDLGSTMLSLELEPLLKGTSPDDSFFFVFVLQYKLKKFEDGI